MSRMTSNLRWSLIGLFALACGGTTEPAASTPSSSGVADTTIMSEVGPTEAATVCNWYYEMMVDSNYVQSLCQQFAVIMARNNEADTSSDAAVQSGCNAAQVGCNAKMQEDMVQKQLTCTTSLDQATCSATVADFEACARAMAQMSYAGLPTCNELTVNYVPSAAYSAPALPAACVALQSSCPEAMIAMRLGA